MKCFDDCHAYELDLFAPGKPDVDLYPFGDSIDPKPFLHFYEMRPDGKKIDGVTNEDVLLMLIHRLKFLNEKWMDGKFRCQENVIAIAHLEAALHWLNERTRDRVARKVEGKHEK